MGLFRSAMGLFRSKAGNREKAEEQTKTAAELPEEQIKTVKAQPEVAPREARYEARPNPDKPGWGLTIGQEIFKVREDRASAE